jgi:hypothetical protein
MEATIRIDGEVYVIDADVASLAELRARLQSAMVRGDVEQLWLTDGTQMSVNWRAVGRVQVIAQG